MPLRRKPPRYTTTSRGKRWHYCGGSLFGSILRLARGPKGLGVGLGGEGGGLAHAPPALLRGEKKRASLVLQGLCVGEYHLGRPRESKS